MRPPLPYRQPAGHEASPRVSIITIFLDEERFLAEAVESVLAQTYEDWELLLCDDGSTDGSPAIARRYAEAYPDRIRVLQHPDGANRGMSATRNLGLAHAQGEFVAFLDGDDVWLPRKLEDQVATLEAHPKAAMTFGPSLWWYSWDPHSSDEDGETALCVAPGGVVRGERVLARVLQLKGDPLFTCSVLARRSAVQEVGGFEERFTGLFEDQAFFSKFLLAHDVCVTARVLDYYRQHPASCCAVASREGGARSSRLLEARRAYLHWLRDYTSDRGHRLRWQVHRECWLHRSPSVAHAVAAFRIGVRNVCGRAAVLAFGASRHLLPRALRTSAWDLWTRTRAHIRNPA